MKSDVSLLYGALNFTGGTYYAVADGMSLGSPEPVLDVLPRLLLDGELVAGDRSSNREITFDVVVTAADGLALAQAEAALVLEVNKARNTLAWKPSGSTTPTSVFDTFRARLAYVFDDIADIQHRRIYRLTIPADPHARSLNPVTQTFTGFSGATGVKEVDILGSVRAPVSLKVTLSSGAPNRVFIWTRPKHVAGFHPLMSTMPSGGTGLRQYGASALSEGPYALVSPGSSSPGTSTVNATLRSASSTNALASTSSTSRMSGAATNLVSYGILNLPPAPVPAEAATNFLVNVTEPVAGTSFMVPLDSTVTYLSGISGAPVSASILWLDTPDKDNVFGNIFVGSTDRAHAWGYMGSAVTLGELHYMEPGGASLWAWAEGASVSSIDVTYYPRWHTNAAS